MILQDKMVIRSKRQLADRIMEMELEGELAAEITSPGQFVHIRVTDTYEPLLRRPISIASYDRDRRRMTIIFRAEGRGTQILAEKAVGISVDVLGPLGNGFPSGQPKPGETVLLVGGGIGVPPLYQLSKELTAAGVRVVHVLGFQTASAVFYEQEFSALGETRIVTADGTAGEKGFVTDSLRAHPVDFSVYYTCGPTPMLSAVQEAYAGKPGYLSFEQRMGCGIGACFACVCETKETDSRPYVKVCSDGPVFPAGVVAI
ncbi:MULTISPECIES: dihydroorotate dehydrogenase electron transfer subunit [Sporosarcina]|uniref:dihydroorotate dehydrogenase electron transfer subunit n=1 Tax=Sporosarcina TaxID=1569 RepID=UPI00058C8F1C|nr:MULTISPECIES: dihydroorotate dehydrogenase electron transfer subunit [Sporosarcina]WJY28794.1 dihydroorotate dehydrogenase electron transfer subunit [Sporosarcina sp. 0.2-SM1T-5]